MKVKRVIQLEKAVSTGEGKGAIGMMGSKKRGQLPCLFFLSFTIPIGLLYIQSDVLVQPVLSANASGLTDKTLYVMLDKNCIITCRSVFCFKKG
jgi:hypothetical protein